MFEEDSAMGTPGRLIKIAVRDMYGQPAAMVEVEIIINGRPSGSILTGTGVSESTVAITDPNASVEVQATATLAGQTQRAHLPPGQDVIQFDFQVTSSLFQRVRPIARCPDGTVGTPCVVCQIGNDQIKICV